jgi:hypothetical protein
MARKDPRGPLGPYYRDPGDSTATGWAAAAAVVALAVAGVGLFTMSGRTNVVIKAPPAMISQENLDHNTLPANPTSPN